MQRFLRRSRYKLSKQPADYFHCSLVSEAGRDIVADSSSFHFTNLYKIANEHAGRTRKAELSPSSLLIMDKDIHITKSYACFAFGKVLDVSDKTFTISTKQVFIYIWQMMWSIFRMGRD